MRSGKNQKIIYYFRVRLIQSGNTHEDYKTIVCFSERPSMTINGNILRLMLIYQFRKKSKEEFQYLTHRSMTKSNYVFNLMIKR